jgi:hypothetical protein
MLKQVTWVEDGMLLSAISPSIALSAQNRGWIDIGGKEPRLKFCGYACIDGNAFFSLPKTTFGRTHSTVERIAYARTVFRAIAKFAQETKSSSSEGAQEEEADAASMTRIRMYQSLLEDWTRFGIYKHIQYLDRVSSRGRVIWPKTIAKIAPYIVDGANTPIYLQTISRLRQNELDNLISEIHSWAVAKADRAIGWLYASNARIILFDELAGVPDILPTDPIYAVSVLRRRLNRTFDYRTIWLLKTLIRVIEDENEWSGGEQVFGLRSFWPIWEHMCRVRYTTLDAHSALLEEMPRPVYHFANGTKLEPPSRQKPDILVQASTGLLWIRDAKYYDITVTTPSWQDVVKQIFYAETIRQAGVAKSTISVFLFPKPKVQSMPHEIKVHDAHGTHLSGIETIRCEYLDLIEVCQKYLSTSMEFLPENNQI